jgi:hypothetical protein
METPVTGGYAVPVNDFHRRRGVLAVAVTLGLAASLLLGGCVSFFPGGSGGGGGTGGNGGSGQSGQNGGTTDDTNSPGDVDLEQFEGVPDTFPTAEIPIIDGDVDLGVDLGTGWTLMMRVDDVQAAYDDASAKLKAAGFEALAEQVGGEAGSFGAFENDKYQVQVTATDTPDGGPSVNYVVVLKG